MAWVGQEYGMRKLYYQVAVGQRLARVSLRLFAGSQRLLVRLLVFATEIIRCTSCEVLCGTAERRNSELRTFGPKGPEQGGTKPGDREHLMV